MDKTLYLIKASRAILEKESPVLHLYRPHRFQLRNALNSLSCWSSSKDEKYFLFNGSHIMNNVPKNDVIFNMHPIQIVPGHSILNYATHSKEIVVVEDMTSLLVKAVIEKGNPHAVANALVIKLQQLHENCLKLVLTSKSTYGMHYLLNNLKFPIQDVTFDEEWSSVCGYTEMELQRHILPKLKSHPFFYNQEDQHILSFLIQTVGGYNFGNEIVAHPTLTQQFTADPVSFLSGSFSLFSDYHLNYVKNLLNKQAFDSIWLTIHEESALKLNKTKLSDLSWLSHESTIGIKVLYDLGLLSPSKSNDGLIKFPNMFTRRYFDQKLVPYLKM